jgi:2'-5' RNA ligase
VPRIRLGVVLLVPEPVATEVDGLRRALGDGSLDRIRPHLTLVPPVNVRVDALGEALAVLRSAAAATEPFTLRLGPPATFHPDTPVVHLAVESDETHALRARVFSPPLARPLTWPFVPHVTLADEVAADRFEPAVAALRDYVVDVDIDRVTLLQEGSGRVWSPLADAVFGAPLVVARGGLPVELSLSTIADPEVAPLLGTDGDGIVVTARRDGVVLGAARGDHVVVTDAAGLEDVEGHLRRAVARLE